MGELQPCVCVCVCLRVFASAEVEARGSGCRVKSLCISPRPILRHFTTTSCWLVNTQPTNSQLCVVVCGRLQRCHKGFFLSNCVTTCCPLSFREIAMFDMASASSVQVVTVVEPLIQYSSSLFPEGTAMNNTLYILPR